MNEKIFNKDECLEIAQIAAIISDAILDGLYHKMQEGYISTTQQIAKWALEFYNENINTNWEELLMSESGNCWDDEIQQFANNKLKDI